MLTEQFLAHSILISSLFFMLGIFIAFQVVFNSLKKILILKQIHFNEYTLRSILGIIYILVLLFSMQVSISNRQSIWAFVNFQLIAVIFYAVILSVPTKYHLFIPIVLVFMVFNSAITNWKSWCAALVLIIFYKSLNYIKTHIKDIFPFWSYLLTSVFFGAIYWFFMKLKFSFSYQVLFQQIGYLIVLELFTFGYMAVQFADLESRTALFQDATHDRLTKAYNYDAFDIDFRSLFKLHKQSNIDITMMMFDIDYFKKVNDTYGHLAGDKILQHVVEIVQDVINNNDKRIKLYRTGGEEFNILFPDYHLKDTKKIVNAIFEAISDSQTKFNGTNIHLSISVGVSEIDPEDGSTNDFYSRVDKALYHSKRHGRGEITVV
ncbi:GGDEF domain-containing protein [Companilactobacillus nuruki]|uniref:GGDEF domain-containing protein n=1 Tax=Companilactobacillus nuruki TaxID=1993540 RepID=A0A2N7AXI5_9LACO|nr:GGDEF domain-containing protein [Companilactobacillus nuruki]PMD73803.1 GGDEF domain-containing protein [Companilactobacillus nuruki]